MTFHVEMEDYNRINFVSRKEMGNQILHFLNPRNFQLLYEKTKVILTRVNLIWRI